ETISGREKAREAVALETPARRATSAIVVIVFPSASVCSLHHGGCNRSQEECTRTCFRLVNKSMVALAPKMKPVTLAKSPKEAGCEAKPRQHCCCCPAWLFC